MDSKTLISFLGYSPASEPLNTWLDDHRVFDRPHSAEQDEAWAEDENEALQNARASEIEEVERDSVCLIYDDRASYEMIYGKAKSKGDYVLRQVAFYAKGVQSYPGYRQALPFQLEFGMDRAAVHALLGLPMASRVIHGLQADLHMNKSVVLNVCYLDDGSIGILHVRLPHKYDLQKIGELKYEADERAIKLNALFACLGRSAYDEELEALLRPLGWQSGDFEMADCDEVPNLIPRYGLTLYYRDAKDFPALANKHYLRDGALFAGFRVNRRGDMRSLGFEGPLPFGIQYFHNPEHAITCVGREPDWVSVGDDIGSYKWNLQTHILHVMFSLIDYQIYRISCFAPFLADELFPAPD